MVSPRHLESPALDSRHDWLLQTVCFRLAISHCGLVCTSLHRTLNASAGPSENASPVQKMLYVALAFASEVNMTLYGLPS